MRIDYAHRAPHASSRLTALSAQRSGRKVTGITDGMGLSLPSALPDYRSGVGPAGLLPAS